MIQALATGTFTSSEATTNFASRLIFQLANGALSAFSGI